MQKKPALRRVFIELIWNVYLRIWYNNPAVTKPTKPAAPSDPIILIRLAITSPGRNATLEPKIT